MIIEQRNIKPSTPVITGNNNSFTNSSILFTIVSSDGNNDELQYFIEWGDGTTTKTEFYPQSTEISLEHAWKKSGTYTMTLRSYDNQLYSEETSKTVNINDVFTANYGYIILLITAIFTFISLSTKTFMQDRALKAMMSA